MSVYWPAWEMKVKKNGGEENAGALERGRNVQQKEVVVGGWGGAGREGEMAKKKKKHQQEENNATGT